MRNTLKLQLYLSNDAYRDTCKSRSIYWSDEAEKARANEVALAVGAENGSPVGAQRLHFERVVRETGEAPVAAARATAAGRRGGGGGGGGERINGGRRRRGGRQQERRVREQRRRRSGARRGDARRRRGRRDGGRDAEFAHLVASAQRRRIAQRDDSECRCGTTGQDRTLFV